MRRWNAHLLVLFIPVILWAQKPYRGAEYRTRSSFTYGRFEVRMKSAGLSGMLSSFFTYHEISSLNDWNEIDIEILGRYPDQVQFNTITPGQTNHVFSQTLAFNPHKDFHIYAIEWTPNYVSWYVDSVEIYRQSGAHIGTLRNAQKLMMNIWPPASEDWVGHLNPDLLPAYAYYDWVRVYQYTPGQNDDFTLLWEDAFNTYDQNRWQKATHTFDGNNAQFIKENAVFHDGYLILCLTKTTPVGYQGGPVSDEDISAPYVASAWFLGEQVVLTFSEKVDREQADRPSNYIIPGLSIQKAHLKEDGRTVVLDVTGRDVQQTYSVICTNIVDRSPAANKIAVKSVSIRNGLRFPALINLGSSEDTETLLPDAVFAPEQPYGREGGEMVLHDPALAISNTDQDQLFQTEVRGLTFYRFRVPDGQYRMTFYFAETEHEQSAARIFDVLIENQKVIENLDIYERVGKNAALPITVEDLVVQDGQLDVYFRPLSGQAVCSAIKIEKQLTGIKEQGKAPLKPEHYGLKIFPNPANLQFQLKYQLPCRGRVQLVFFDSSGRRFKKLDLGEQMAGEHQYELKAEQWASGTYFCQLLQNGQALEQNKVVLLK